MKNAADSGQVMGRNDATDRPDCHPTARCNPAPPTSFSNDDVIIIHFTNGIPNSDQRRQKLVLSSWLRDWFIEEIVSPHDGLVDITAGDMFPDGGRHGNIVTIPEFDSVPGLVGIGVHPVPEIDSTEEERLPIFIQNFGAGRVDEGGNDWVQLKEVDEGGGGR
eukprot:CCRYP_008323-RA/>CCRYP_008323-RA protein AED:0.17 eAED:0.33 QI:1854/0/0.25/1/0/0/4/0/162